MTIYHADPAAARLLQLSVLSLTFSGCMAAAFMFGESLLSAIFCAALALLSAVLCIGIPLSLRSLSCVVSPSQITVRQGIVFRREQSVLLHNVQFVRIIHGPFGGAGGLNFIILHVYGGMLAAPFLSRRDRLAITEFLRQKGVFHAP